MDNVSLSDLAASSLGAGFLGLVGRALSYARAGRPPLRWGLLFELPLAYGMGLIGHGVADYLGVQQATGVAIIVVVSYLGPPAIDMIVARFTAGRK